VRRLTWTARALQDLRDSRDYIAADNPDAAERIVAGIRRTAERIAQFPESGRPMGRPGLREAQIPRTPYRLVYKAGPDMIEIIALWHGARQWPSDDC